MCADSERAALTGVSFAAARSRLAAPNRPDAHTYPGT